MVHASPRILAVVLRAGGTSFGVIVGHAPTSAFTDEVREDWWAQLDSVLARFSRHLVPILFLDANARVRAHSDSSSFRSAEGLNHNAKCMAALLAERKLETTPLFLPSGQRPVTWTSPFGNTAQLDYVVLPEELASCSLTIGEPAGFVDHNGVDHKYWQQLCRGWLRYGAGLQQFPSMCKPCAPTMDRPPFGPFTRMLLALTGPYTRTLTYRFTMTICLMRFRVAFLRLLHVPGNPTFRTNSGMHRLKSLRARLCVAGIFKACFTEARHVLTVQSLSTAREQGPSTLAHLLRGVLKTGRRYKAPRVQASLVVDGNLLSEPGGEFCRARTWQSHDGPGTALKTGALRHLWRHPSPGSSIPA